MGAGGGRGNSPTNGEMVWNQSAAAAAAGAPGPVVLRRVPPQRPGLAGWKPQRGGVGAVAAQDGRGWRFSPAAALQRAERGLRGTALPGHPSRRHGGTLGHLPEQQAPGSARDTVRSRETVQSVPPLLCCRLPPTAAKRWAVGLWQQVLLVCRGSLSGCRFALRRRGRGRLPTGTLCCSPRGARCPPQPCPGTLSRCQGSCFWRRNTRRVFFRNCFN